jgi:hypothetical protein
MVELDKIDGPKENPRLAIVKLTDTSDKDDLTLL